MACDEHASLSCAVQLVRHGRDRRRVSVRQLCQKKDELQQALQIMLQHMAGAFIAGSVATGVGTWCRSTEVSESQKVAIAAAAGVFGVGTCSVCIYQGAAFGVAIISGGFAGVAAYSGGEIVREAGEADRRRRWWQQQLHLKLLPLSLSRQQSERK